MATVSSDGKVAYIYDQPTDTWYPVAGSANTSQSYVWSGTHTYQNTATFNQVLTAKAGVNNFANPAARDAAITSPTNGIVAFVRTDASGNQTNHIQYYSNGTWRVYGDNANLVTKTTGFTLAAGNGGRTFLMENTSNSTVTIPTDATTDFPVGTQMAFIRANTGTVTFAAADGTTTSILSKNSNKKIAAQYSQALLVKKSADAWLLMGDLTA